MNDKGEGLEEGCGVEGPLRGAFFAEFDADQGPRIRCQVPQLQEGKELISREVFDALSVFIIPKQQLASRTMTVNALGFKILGFPIIIEDKKYRRNQFMFNICFVCYTWSRSVQFETAIKKLANYLVHLEHELEYLSSGKNNDELVSLLGQVFYDLNSSKETTLIIKDYSIQLKVTRHQTNPAPIRDHDVPLLLVSGLDNEIKCDLTSKQILSFINGIHQVSTIASKADVDVNLVKSCIQNFLYFGVIKIVSIFQFSNSYCITPQIMSIKNDPQLRKEFLEVASADEDNPVTFHQAFTFVTSLVHGCTLYDVCKRLEVGSKVNINVMALIQFLSIKGIIRRIHNYPYYVQNQQRDADSPIPREILQHFTGTKCLDEICCITGLTSHQLNNFLEKDRSVKIISK